MNPVLLGSLTQSSHSQHRVRVQFINTIPRSSIDLLWLNFQGEEELYTTLASGERWSGFTFGSHPWIARSSSSTQPAFQWAGERKPFFEAYRWGRQTYQRGSFSQAQLVEFLGGNLVVTVRLVQPSYPLHSLRTVCLRKVATLLPPQADPQQLELPPPLATELERLHTLSSTVAQANT